MDSNRTARFAEVNFLDFRVDGEKAMDKAEGIAGLVIPPFRLHWISKPATLPVGNYFAQGFIKNPATGPLRSDSANTGRL